MNSRKLRVALVGCGQIADAHLGEIRRIPLVEPVAVCDQHPELAQQAAARFEVPGVFANLDQMLDQAKPDVVHITTPPHTHRVLALRTLSAGIHTYLEKPFTVDVAEADDVLRAAEASQRLVCVGHDQLFDPAWQECRELYRRGDLGKVVHVDAILGYDMSGPFGKVTASEPDHWVHRLPGGLFHNTISHALYKITDFLMDERPQVWATWFGDPKVAGCPTELRVLLQGLDVTGNLVSSSAARPVQRVTRVYGMRRSIEVDLDGRLVRHYRSPALRGPFIKLEMPWRHAREAARTLRRNFGRLLRSELHYFTGMHGLFTRYYRAILGEGELPIPYAEIRRGTAILDQIFRCCREGEARLVPSGETGVAAARISAPVGNGVRPPASVEA